MVRADRSKTVQFRQLCYNFISSWVTSRAPLALILLEIIPMEGNRNRDELLVPLDFNRSFIYIEGNIWNVISQPDNLVQYPLVYPVLNVNNEHLLWISINCFLSCYLIDYRIAFWWRSTVAKVLFTANGWPHGFFIESHRRILKRCWGATATERIRAKRQIGTFFGLFFHFQNFHI